MDESFCRTGSVSGDFPSQPTSPAKSPEAIGEMEGWKVESSPPKGPSKNTSLGESALISLSWVFPGISETLWWAHTCADDGDRSLSECCSVKSGQVIVFSQGSQLFHDFLDSIMSICLD